MDGFVLVNKPAGAKSSEVTLDVARRIGANKAGHAGTLDPNATGVLLIALDGAVKYMDKVMHLEKEYEGTIKFHGNIQAEKIATTARKFVGKIKQVPPKRSAVARKERTREIYGFDIKPLNDREAEFKLRCESGFYVRKLAHDLGESIGIKAQLWRLKRTKLGPFDIMECIELKDVKSGGKARIMDIVEVLKRVGV